MKKLLLFILVCSMPIITNCGGSSSTPATDTTKAASLQNVDQIGALMANDDGETFMPMVSRNTFGNATGITGAQWTGADGQTVTLYLNSTTGLPEKMVYGDYFFLFNNWSSTALTVDVAVVYAPTNNYVKIYKGVNINHSDIPTHLAELQSMSADISSPGMSVGVGKTFCFPACDNDTANLSGLIKVAGLSFSLAACGLGVAATGGALLPALVVPCGSLIISTATLVVDADTWLGSTTEATATVLAAHSVLTCSANPVECVASVLEAGSNMVLGSDSELTTYSTNVTQANTFLTTKPDGYNEGTAPSGCLTQTTYECTSGSYMPCYTGGSKLCGSDCTWGTCPSSSGGNVSTLAGTYTGSYSGSCETSDGTISESGSVGLTIASTSLTVTAPLGGTGTVAALGGSTFGAGGGGGITYTFNGSFVLVGPTGSFGSGRWSATDTDAVCSGTWNASR